MGDTVIDAWSAYWRTGQSASCFCGDQGQVRFAGLWRDFVTGFPSGARLIDLATGNGSAVLACASHAREVGLDLSFHAVDAAQIDPARYGNDPLHHTIAFMGGIRLEQLPFADASFEGALSQFGFEYADQAKAASEVARVLTPDGRMRLVMHAKDGAVSQDIQGRLHRLERAMTERGPMGLVRTLVRAAEAQDWERVRRGAAQLPRAMAMLERLAADAPPDDAAVFYSNAFLTDWAQRDRFHPADLCRAVEDGWTNAAGVALRQRQMLRAARSSSDLVSLNARLRRLGLAMAPPLAIRDERQAQIAWLVDAVKAA